MTHPSSVRLILLPGLGADERLYEAQRAAFPGLVVPPWIVPKRKEPLPDYARRLAETISPVGPMVLGGASFGGMVAYEAARHLRPDAVVLIGSCRTPKALSRFARALRPLVPCVPVQGFDLGKLASPAGLGLLGPFTRQQRAILVAMVKNMDSGFMKWACRALLAWQPGEPPPVPVRQIHGAKDPIMPVGLAEPDEVVAGAGHLLSVTHPQQVNAFLLRTLETVRLS